MVPAAAASVVLPSTNLNENLHPSEGKMTLLMIISGARSFKSGHSTTAKVVDKEINYENKISIMF